MKFLTLALIFTSRIAYSAACCGGGFNMPSVILGDDKAQITSTLTQGQVTDDVSPSGIWSPRDNKDVTQTFKVEGAYLLSDRFQVGAGVPVVRRTIDSGHSSTENGLGDINFVGAYEILPELDYSVWKPKGFVYSQVIAPTGNSVYQSNNSSGSDITGRGFWSWGVGSIFSKIIRDFDLQVLGEIHKSFDKSLSNNVTLVPGWGQLVSLGGGYSYKAYRLGTSLSFAREDAIQVSGVSSSGNSSSQQFATASFQFNWLLEKAWAATLSYSDQRLFGAPQNTTLSQIWSLSLQRKWER